jgi:hypothetical protein
MLSLGECSGDRVSVRACKHGGKYFGIPAYNRCLQAHQQVRLNRGFFAC